jgi:mannitol-1-phosphate 5-dehydrogenase
MRATFVGFGFGPIQTGLMLCEAVASGSFERFVIAEVDQGLVDAVRAAGGSVAINVAGRGSISTRILPRLELYNPRVPEDRKAVVSAIGDASELATAIPSVDYYTAGGEASIAAMIAAGADDGRQRIVYTAENNNFAAEILRAAMEKNSPGKAFKDLQILNTVVGKMSGAVSSPAEMKRLGLAPLVQGFEKCVLVEEFNRILISRVTLPGFTRGIRVFEEKDDLLPFEEAKLFGHNAVHAVLGYLAWLRGYDVMSRIGEDPKLLAFGGDTLLLESGAALRAKHGGTGDPLFTETGYAAYAEDLLGRIINPWLLDRVERITRDPRRKLGWDDRLFGTMRLAMSQGIEPRRTALAAAAAVEFAREAEQRGSASPRNFLNELWGRDVRDPRAVKCIALVEESRPALFEWRGRHDPAYARSSSTSVG